MNGGLRKRLHDWERSLHARYTHDIVDPIERKRSEFYVNWLDHGILRHIWSNHAEVAEGVWRSNHPSQRRISKLVDKGLRTIVNLRGGVTLAHHRLEEESCKSLGVTLVDVPMSARNAPDKKTLLDLIRVLGEAEKPVLLHCKSGADRTGLASAIYLLAYCNASVSEARRHLSPRFLHFRQTKTGILDHVIDFYDARLALGPISFMTWVDEEYEPGTVSDSFNNLRAKRKGQGNSLG